MIATVWTGFIRLYTFAGSSVPMPEELMELYNLYQQELHTRQVLEIIDGALLSVWIKNGSMAFFALLFSDERRH